MYLRLHRWPNGHEKGEDYCCVVGGKNMAAAVSMAVSWNLSPVTLASSVRVSPELASSVGLIDPSPHGNTWGEVLPHRWAWRTCSR